MDNNTFYLLRFEPLVSEAMVRVRASPFQLQQKQIKNYMHRIHLRRKHQRAYNNQSCKQYSTHV